MALLLKYNFHRKIVLFSSVQNNGLFLVVRIFNRGRAEGRKKKKEGPASVIPSFRASAIKSTVCF
jgi:hypothetical protein